MTNISRFLIFLAALYFLLRATSVFASSGSELSKAVAVGSAAYMAYNIKKSREYRASCSGPNAMACSMMALSLVQALEDSKSAESGIASAKGFIGDNNWPTTPLPNGFTGADLDRQLNQSTQEMNDLIKEARAKGYNIDPKTGTIMTPKKGALKPAQLASGAALAEAGLIDPSQIAEADALLKESKSGLKKIAVQMTNTSGGGGGARAPSATYTYEPPSYSGFNFGEREKPAPPKTAGLIKMVNGEPIGAATGDIFEMIHRKYQQKVAERIFVGQEEN